MAITHIPFYADLLDIELPNGKSTTNSHVLVYGAIEVFHTGPRGCIASNKKIGEVTGLKERTVANVVSALAKIGWLNVKIDENNHRKSIVPLLGICTPPSLTNEPPLHSRVNPPSLTSEHKEQYINHSKENIADKSASSSNPVSFGGQYGGRSSAPADEAAPEPPTARKLLYDVCKKYELPITNHNNIRKWANDLDKMDDGEVYLQRLLDKDLRKAEGQFRPTLNQPYDVIAKKLKIQRFWNGGEDKSSTRDKRVYGDWA